MNRIATTLFLFFVLTTALPASSQGQDTWYYSESGSIGFAEADSMAFPYLGTFDASGVLWVISSAVDSQFANNGLNALFRAAPGETVFTRVATYEGVFGTTGITAHGNDIYVSMRLANPSQPRDPFYPHTAIHRYPDGTPDFREVFSDAAGHWDYGSWFTGLAATESGMVYAGRSWMTTIVAYDFRPEAPSPGATVSQAGDNSAPLEPGGGMDGYGSNFIRQVALIPGGDYDQASTPVYTSRNQSMYDPNAPAGGVAVWTGGTQADLSGYTAQRLSDPGGALIFEGKHPNGIAVDAAGQLFVAGTAGRWAKVFEVFQTLALESGDLPSATTVRVEERDEDGAPFVEPSGIIVSDDGSRVFVLDRRAQKAFYFSTTLSSSVNPEEGLARAFVLGRNYPNPFNPSTVIPFELLRAASVRLSVYDMLGRRVATLADETRLPGHHRIFFDASGLPTGTYVYRLETPDGTASGRMMLVR
jgi:hypothetical protein